MQIYGIGNQEFVANSFEEAAQLALATARDLARDGQIAAATCLERATRNMLAIRTGASARPRRPARAR